MPISFQRQTLPNGLTVIAELVPDAHTSAVGYFVKTGSRDEQRPLMGVSHFLEHMMFKGTDRRSADDVNREFDEIGANYNAYTSQETTVYYAQVLPQFFDRAIDLIGDMLRPALRAQDFDMEKKVILEEISMYEDRPQWRLQDSTLESYFGQHPLGYRVLGTSDSVKALTPAQMRDYFAARYSPDNITVAASGRLDFDHLVQEVARTSGHWKPTGAVRDYQPAGINHQEQSLTDAKVNRHYVCMMCPGPSAQDPRRYAARILCDVLGDSDGSRLYWALVDPGLADEADFSFFPQDQLGAYGAYASCDPGRAKKVEKILLQTLDRYISDIDLAEIERAKNKLATQTTLAGESPAGRMRGLGNMWVYLGEYQTLDEELEKLMAITPQDIHQLLEDFPFTPRTVVRLGPTKVKRATASK